MMDTLILVAAFCLHTDQPVSGWLVLGGDSITIHTSLHCERSKVQWVSPTDAVTEQGTTLRLKPGIDIELYRSRKFFVLAGTQSSKLRP